MSEVTTIGLDLAKHVFQVHGIDAQGATVLRKRLRRGQVLAFFSRIPRCLVGLEACATAHYWARELAALGHEVRLMPAQYVSGFWDRLGSQNQHQECDSAIMVDDLPDAPWVTGGNSPDAPWGLIVAEVAPLVSLSMPLVRASKRNSVGSPGAQHERARSRSPMRASHPVEIGGQLGTMGCPRDRAANASRR